MWETTAKLHLISSLLIGLCQGHLPPTWLTKSKPSEHKTEPIIKLYIVKKKSRSYMVSIITMMWLNLELGFTIKKKNHIILIRLGKLKYYLTKEKKVVIFVRYIIHKNRVNNTYKRTLQSINFDDFVVWKCK